MLVINWEDTIRICFQSWYCVAAFINSYIDLSFHPNIDECVYNHSKCVTLCVFKCINNKSEWPKKGDDLKCRWLGERNQLKCWMLTSRTKCNGMFITLNSDGINEAKTREAIWYHINLCETYSFQCRVDHKYFTITTITTITTHWVHNIIEIIVKEILFLVFSW